MTKIGSSARDAGGPHLASAELAADPYREFGRIREQAPVVAGRYLDGSPVHYVGRYDDVRLVLGDTRFANSPSNAPGAEAAAARDRLVESLGVSPELAHYVVGSILDSDGPTHVRLRKLVSRAFTVRRVAELRGAVERITAVLLDELAAEGTGPVDLVERFCYPLPITVICDLVGVPEADRVSWRVWGRELVDMRPDHFAPALRAVVDHLHVLISTKRRAPADDLLSALIRTQDEDGDRLSDVELATMVLTLVFAGHETTAHLIGNAVVALLTHPEQLGLLREDPERWPSAVGELMRWCGPVLITALRYAKQDVELGGALIRAGEAVQPVLAAANRDPRQYDDPERLDILRHAGGHGDGHVGFGHGVHYCLGAALARQEGEVALHALFDRFPGLALDIEPSALGWQPIPGTRRLAALPVRLA